MEVTIGDIYYAVDMDELAAVTLGEIVEKTHLQNESNSFAERNLGYWLDNCGDGE